MAGKRLKGDGCIKDKGRDANGKRVFEVVVSFGRNPVTGGYDQVSRTVHGTLTKARRVRDELKEQHEHGLSAHGNRCTFSELSSSWLKERVRSGDFARTTTDDNERVIEVLCGYIGDIRLSDISVKTVRDVLADVRGDGDGARSGARMTKYYRVLSQVMQRAVDDDMILVNPCARVKPPKVEESERRSLTASEARTLLDNLNAQQEDAYRRLDGNEERLGHLGKGEDRSSLKFLPDASQLIAVRIGLAVGARLSEVLALDWDSIDLDGGRIVIDKSQTADGTIKEPKTKAGKRTVSIDATTCEALAEWKARQAGYLAIIKLCQSGETPVVCSSMGERIPLARFERWWRSHRKKLGFEELHYHELRHTQATLLLANGTDVKTVQARLGHANASLTLNWYAHPLEENDKKAANLLGEVLEVEPLKLVRSA